MLNITIAKGALWYWQTRHREWIEFTEPLRNETRTACQETYKLFQEQKTPKAIYDKKCKACSLIELCQPQKMTNDKSTAYNQSFFKI
jgi:CRISPR-associated exonuclease Cas4